MSRRTTTCSQCGQEGHTKRNLYCPVNVRFRELAWEEEERQSEEEAEALRLHRAAVESDRLRIEAQRLRLAAVEAQRLRDEEEEAVRLRAATALRLSPMRHAREAQGFILDVDGLVAQYSRREIGRHVFIIQVLDTMRFVCCSISDIVGNELERRRVMANFVIRIGSINRALQCMSPRESIEMVYDTTLPWVSFRTIPLVVADNRQPKLSSAYWKECSLVKDFSIGEPDVQCPLCFDEVSGPDVIRTNCNHSYCGCCIKRLASSSRNKPQKPTCPMCRTDITKLTVGNDTVYTEIRAHFITL